MPLHDLSPGAVFLTKLFDQTLAAAQANFDIQGIPGEFSSLMISLIGRGTASAADSAIMAQFNGDTGANYDYLDVELTSANVYASSTTFTQTSMQVGYVSAATAVANSAGTNTIWIHGYSGTTFHKTVQALSNLTMANSGNSQYYSLWEGGRWRSTAAINRVTLALSAGNFDVGSRCILYGLP